MGKKCAQTLGCWLAVCLFINALDLHAETVRYASLGSDLVITCPGQNVNTWLKFETNEFLALCENGLQRINTKLNLSSRLNITPDCNELTIYNFSMKDTGMYVCFIVNKETERHKFELNIKIRSISIVEANNAEFIKCIEGENVTLTCIVVGEILDETLHWTTENNLLASNDTNYVEYTFLVHRSHNMQEFVCSSNTSLISEQLTAKIRLELIKRPLAPHHIQVVALYTEIMVKWKAGYSDLQQQMFFVEYQDRFQSKWIPVHTINTSSVTISGLQQDVFYSVRMFSRTKAGDSNKTDEIITKTGIRQSQCYSLELAVSFAGILSIILFCWCGRNGSKNIHCCQRNQYRNDQSGGDNTEANRQRAQYDEIESIQSDPDGTNSNTEADFICSRQLHIGQVFLNKNSEHSDSNFDLNIFTNSDISSNVMEHGLNENRNILAKSSSEESYLVPCRQYIDVQDDSRDELDENREFAANGYDTPNSRLSQSSETNIKIIQKYETLLPTTTNIVGHSYATFDV